MHKVYLLLRNNHQTGPFNLDELLQQELKSTDLIWEEGKSAGWSYPSEVESLKSFFHVNEPINNPPITTAQQSQNQDYIPLDTDAPFASKKVTSKNVYVCLPGHSLHRADPPHLTIEESLEQKAEAIRKRALTSTEHKQAQIQGETIGPNYELETNFSRSLGEVGEDYSAWLYTQKIEKKKKARRKRTIAFSISTICLIVIGFALFKGYTSESNLATQGENENLQSDNTVGITKEDNRQETLNEPNEKVQFLNTEKDPNPIPAASVSVKNGTPSSKSTSNKVFDSVKSTETTNINVIHQPQINNDQITKEENNTPEVASLPKRKETFGDKIGDFFERFKSKDKENNPSNKQAKNEKSTAEGGAKRRTDEPTPAQANLTDFVSVTSNAPSENWMMGVQGLKLTLYNKSNETVKTAVVEVRYYNEDKDLLEKKTVYFNNVSPKASQTVPAPDHRLADHTDYQIISAIAKEDAYVKQ